ncbi:hypothetical protein [Haloquadratum walsbyi]|uniref:Uncharacterized protein n=1 Tax=Haloquadratum walsbyi J07HQW2 TaxID=1238425 RepID=U1NFX5_9EURY|nr:hypothetical protein [Haloquadratum walsbyi]ERG96000.1 MAG: hypothetical protein J07HQW2_02464 [Haloquadratum walsbyi J07HQW2]
MSDSDDDEVIGSIAGNSTATYDQIRVEMESGEFVVTGFYLETETVYRAEMLSIGGVEVQGLTGKLELNNADNKYLWLITEESGSIQIRNEKPE